MYFIRLKRKFVTLVTIVRLGELIRLTGEYLVFRQCGRNLYLIE